MDVTLRPGIYTFRSDAQREAPEGLVHRDRLANRDEPGVLAAGRVDVRLAVELRVQLRAEEDRQRGVVEPEQQDDRRRRASRTSSRTSPRSVV